MRALIVEPGDTRGALAAARALGGDGWTVGVGTPSGGGLASTSRFTSRRHAVPGPSADLDGFVRGVNAAVAEVGYEVVLAGGDAELMGVSARREELRLAVPHPPHGRVLEALDKLSLGDNAAECGIASPRAVAASDASLSDHGFPLIVKARLHAPLVSRKGPSRLESMVAADRAQAVSRIAQIRASGGEPLLQEFVPGRLMAYCAVTDSSGSALAAAQQIADATWPRAAGISARARTVPIDREIAERAGRLLKRIGWFGLVQLQFVLADGGEAWLIDFNGRLYSSLGLAVRAGANLPAAWASLATGRAPNAPVSAVAGVRYHWLEGDVRRVTARGPRAVPAGLLDCASYAQGAVRGYWSMRDPLPAVRRTGVFLKRVARKAWGWTSSRQSTR